mgnify:CR=1 FL=1
MLGVNIVELVNLPLIWGVIILIAAFMYVALDGFDLGVGILLVFAPNASSRDTMIKSISPFWDGNETWIVMTAGGLLAVFPLAYGVIMTALYVPTIIMLLALVLRGVSIECRYKATVGGKAKWDYICYFASLLAVVMQGIIFGALIRGIVTKNGIFVGHMLDSFNLFTIGIAVIFIFQYVLLGATWVVMKSSGSTQAWGRNITQYASLTLAVLSLCTIFIVIMKKYHLLYDIKYIAILICCTCDLVIQVLLGFVLSKRENVVCGLFWLAELTLFIKFATFIIQIWPWVVPYSISVYDAAADPKSLSFLLVGTLVLLPMILCYTAYSYHVFRGKCDEKRK